MQAECGCKFHFKDLEHCFLVQITVNALMKFIQDTARFRIYCRSLSTFTTAVCPPLPLAGFASFLCRLLLISQCNSRARRWVSHHLFPRRDCSEVVPLSPYADVKINVLHIICRRLTQALLFRDFDIQLEIPDDRLCPPVPNRWVEIACFKVQYLICEINLDSITSSGCMTSFLTLSHKNDRPLLSVASTCTLQFFFCNVT